MTRNRVDPRERAELARLEQRLVAHSNSKRLDARELARLRTALRQPCALATDAARRAPARDPGRGLVWALALAAAVLLVVSWRAGLFPSSQEAPRWPERFAAEAAGFEAIAAEEFVAGADLDELGARLPSVDFALEHARRFSGLDLRLIGGAAGTLDGRPAAALRYDTEEGRSLTVLQLPLVEQERESGPLAPCLLDRNEYRIEVWQEGGRAFCLLEERTSAPLFKR